MTRKARSINWNGLAVVSTTTGGSIPSPVETWKQALEIFNLAAADAALVSEYRRKLASALH